MDDSGYSSPPKRSGEEDKTRFLYEIPSKGSSASQIMELVARKDVTLASAIDQKYPGIEINNRIFWAKIPGQVGFKYVNPYLLQCRFIEPETHVKSENYSRTIYDYEFKLDDTKTYSKLNSDPSCKLFYISIGNRKNKKGITHVHYNNLGGHNVDICVVANPGETFKEALTRDGRFKNLQCFTLKRKVDGREAVVDINCKPYMEEMVFEVEVRATPQSTISTNPISQSKYPSSSTSESATINDMSEDSEKDSEKDVLYVYSKKVSELTNEEMLNEMEQCLRALARRTLVAKDRRVKNYEKTLEKLVKCHFANCNVKARPVVFSKQLYDVFDSVGIIICGSVKATCFLVSNDMIVTNYHVVAMIVNARRASTHSDHTYAFVYFDYEVRDRGGDTSSGYKLSSFLHARNVLSEKLDYAFLCLERPVPAKLALGKYVSCRVPDAGDVCIVGHPNGNGKYEETCPILPFQRRSQSLEERLAKRFQNNGRECVHFYGSDIRRLQGDMSALTYDVGSMFKGASGAPVFDMRCNIVALHTLGFLIGETSLIEAGVTFKAIIQDLDARGRSDFVNELFPCCRVEDMETEDMH